MGEVRRVPLSVTKSMRIAESDSNSLKEIKHRVGVPVKSRSRAVPRNPECHCPGLPGPEPLLGVGIAASRTGAQRPTGTFGVCGHSDQPVWLVAPVSRKIQHPPRIHHSDTHPNTKAQGNALAPCRGQD